MCHVEPLLALEKHNTPPMKAVSSISTFMTTDSADAVLPRELPVSVTPPSEHSSLPPRISTAITLSDFDMFSDIEEDDVQDSKDLIWTEKWENEAKVLVLGMYPPPPNTQSVEYCVFHFRCFLGPAREDYMFTVFTELGTLKTTLLTGRVLPTTWKDLMHYCKPSESSEWSRTILEKANEQRHVIVVGFKRRRIHERTIFELNVDAVGFSPSRPALL